MIAPASSAAETAGTLDPRTYPRRGAEPVCPERLRRRIDARTGAPGRCPREQPLQPFSGQGRNPGSDRQRAQGRPVRRAGSRRRAIGSFSKQPAAFCRQFALDLVDQWSDPREHQFQKVITAERNRVPGVRAKFADQFYSREQRLMTDYFRGFALAGLISTTDPREAGAADPGRADHHPARAFTSWARRSSAARKGDRGHRPLSRFFPFLADARGEGCG